MLSTVVELSRAWAEQRLWILDLREGFDQTGNWARWVGRAVRRSVFSVAGIVIV